MKLNDMDNVFLTNKAIANEAASLAALTKQTIININDILARLAKIQGNDAVRSNIHDLIGDEVVYNQIMSIGGVEFSAAEEWNVYDSGAYPEYGNDSVR